MRANASKPAAPSPNVERRNQAARGATSGEKRRGEAILQYWPNREERGCRTATAGMVLRFLSHFQSQAGGQKAGPKISRLRGLREKKLEMYPRLGSFFRKYARTKWVQHSGIDAVGTPSVRNLEREQMVKQVWLHFTELTPNEPPGVLSIREKRGSPLDLKHTARKKKNWARVAFGPRKKKIVSLYRLVGGMGMQARAV